ncbi:MAG TPA: hypothetical protein VHS09_16985 [Polyangiaceae bacterium]|jgi:hypothetical protein|nr:hypothetical protein [Polyangiaceae bacterium]
MKRAASVLLALAVTGCGNILGIEVLGYDGGDDGGAEHDATGVDAPTTDDATGDAPGAEGSAKDGAPGADATADTASGGDSMSGVDSTAPDGGSDTGSSDTGTADTFVADTGTADSFVADSGAADTFVADTSTADTFVADTGTVEAGCATGTTGCTGNTPWSCVGGVVTDGAACSNQTCVSGTCTGVCAPGQTQCASGNSLFQSCKADGTWGTTATCTGPTQGSPTCSPSTGCGAGTCSSPSFPNLCGTACTNLTNDAYNCGVCGQTCTGTTCGAGYCATQTMCDGTGSPAGANNAGNAARIALQIGTVPPLMKVLFGYFAASGSVFGCELPTTPLSPVPQPTVEIARVGGVCSENYGDAVADKNDAYSFATAGVDCHGTSLHEVPGGDNIGSPAFGPLVSDVATAQSLYTLASPVLELVTFGTQTDGGTTTSSVGCITVSGTLGDGAAGGGFVVAVDTTGGVLRGAGSNGTTCSKLVSIATGITSETAVAVAPSGAMLAFTNGTNLYACPTTGCTGPELATPYATGIGTVAQFGLVFDDASPPNLYFVGSQGLERCSSVTPGGTCTPVVLVPGLAATSGLGVDSTYAYYLQGMIMLRVPK